MRKHLWGGGGLGGGGGLQANREELKQLERIPEASADMSDSHPAFSNALHLEGGGGLGGGGLGGGWLQAAGIGLLHLIITAGTSES